MWTWLSWLTTEKNWKKWKEEKYLDLARERKKIVENESDKLYQLEIRGDHPNYGIIEIGQNTEKSPEDLRKLAITQTSVNDHYLTLM